MPVEATRLVAIDLDGTLLDSSGEVSARAAERLHALREQGCHVVYVTARPPRFVEQLVRKTLIHCAAICANGAVVYDTASNEITRINGLPPAAAAQLVARMRQQAPGVSFACEIGMKFGREPSYVPRGEELPDAGQLVADALDFCREPLNKLLARHPSMPLDALHDVAAGATHHPISITRSTDEFLEIAGDGVNKARTLADYCRSVGVSREEVLAIGDMPNDLPMLRWAGRGVAMAKAHPAVLEVAAEVTLSNNDDGVALVLERLLAPTND